MDLSSAIHLLGNILGDVITELESRELFATEERIRAAAKDRRGGTAEAAKQLEAEVEALSLDQARAVSAAFTTYFDLINLAEEYHRVRQLRERELKQHPEPLPEFVGDAVAALKKDGVTSAQMRSLLHGLSLELVLTAHPTESRRRTVVSKLQRIAQQLETLADDPLTPRERERLTAEMHAEVVGLWLTDRTRTVKMTVTDEVKTGLYFVESVFWDALPELYADLDQALASHYPGVASPPNWFRLASWMGGDRDGNPNVTHEVTAETLRLHRGLAVESHRRTLQDLARRLSMSSERLPASPALTAWIESRRPLPPHVKFIEERYSAEPYRLVLSLLAADLAEASSDDMTARLLGRTPHQARIHLKDLLEPVELISATLPDSLKRNALEQVRRQLNIFGLQAMRLDIREEFGAVQLRRG